MRRRIRRRWLASAGGAVLVIGAAIGLRYALAEPEPEPAIAAAFEASPPVWPPDAPASLAAELATTRAMRRITGADWAPGAPLPDAGVRGDVAGLQVRTGVDRGLYYVEAVFGAAGFDDPMPMAVVIHGRGDRARIPGGPFWDLGAPVRVIVPQAPEPLGDGFQWLPVRVGSGLVDQLTASLADRAAQLASLLSHLRRRLPTVGKPIVIGFSQGGMLTLALATHHSDVVGAAFPIAAWLPPALVPRYRRDDLAFPVIRSMHGTADRVIQLEPTRDLFADLREQGFEIELVPFEGAGHEVTDAMNTQLHVWLDEVLGAVVEQGVRDGLLDGGMPPCRPPDGGWLEGGWPEGGVDGGAPEAGPWWPCPDGGAGDGGLDASL